MLKLISRLAILTAAVGLAACSENESTGARTGAMRCKLESEKIVFQGGQRKKMCTYRCDDGSVEGRNRKPEQECLSLINSADG
jgi:hypothetical protein